MKFLQKLIKQLFFFKYIAYADSIWWFWIFIAIIIGIIIGKIAGVWAGIFSGFLTALILQSIKRQASIPQNAKWISYDQFVKQAKTGDIVLFHGISTMCHLIETFEYSLWSHVGMVLKSKNDDMLLWHSTHPHCKDVQMNSAKSGPQVVSLHDCILHHIKAKEKYVAYIPLTKELNNSHIEKLHGFIHKVHDRPFPSAVRLLERLIEGHFNISAKFKHYFCSELMADTFMHLGIMAKTRPPNRYSPKHFSSEGDANEYMNKDINLSNEIFINLEDINQKFNVPKK